MTKGRRELEKNVFEKMTVLYCQGNNHGESAPCEKCAEIIEYACKRIDACRFGDNKPFCSKCKVHCFKPDMREEVKKIMRYSGPRIIFYHPILALKHALMK